jgi:predicted RNA-binding protein with PUA-like domain
MNHWLLKSEPDVFSFDDLKARPRRREPWNGVRNYQVRNFFRDEMKVGDLGFFYHSSCPVPGIPGVVEIVSAAVPDPSAFDPASDYFDPKSDPASPRWLQVEVAWRADFKQFVTLASLREHAELAELLILRRGNRLSVTPVEAPHFALICRLGGIDPKKL